MSTILIVDDSAVVQRIITMTLESNGYNVITAGDGVEALSILNDTHVDLVLSDILMPEMNGLEMLRRIRSKHDKHILPVVMLTALDDDEERDEADVGGANGFLSKPTNSHALLSTVNDILNSK